MDIHTETTREITKFDYWFLTMLFCILIIGTLLFIKKFIDPKTDYIKQNNIKLENSYGVPKELVERCNPLITKPIDPICEKYIKLK
jgi:hypothetical protein